jgi:hypothetical protein
MNPCVASFQDAITKSETGCSEPRHARVAARSDRSQALYGKGNERGCSGEYVFGKCASDRRGLKLIEVKIYVKICCVKRNFSRILCNTPQLKDDLTIGMRKGKLTARALAALYSLSCTFAQVKCFR